MQRMGPVGVRYFVLRGAVLGAAVSALAAGAPAAQAMSDKDEAAMGHKIQSSLEALMGGVLPASDPVAKRVERIGKRFASLAPKRAFPFRYRVLDSPSILNAFAAPGGTIYVTRRMVSFARSDDELASVLGHETAHVSQRHIAHEARQRESFVLFTARLARASRRAALEDGAREAARIAKITKTPAAKARAARLAHLAREQAAPVPKAKELEQGSAAGTISWWLLSRGRSRAMESEADALSARWMKKLGYNPRAAITLLQHAEAKMPRSAGPLSSLLASHPGVPQRVQDLRALIEREGLDLKAKISAVVTPTPAPTPQTAPSPATADPTAAAP